MSKPIIFFSHASADSSQLLKLKKLISEKTNGTIEIFMSSDGQSIPLGRNWVHKIEAALGEASLMFVFITPNSLHSQWIFFESGFFYSKNKKVVPIGLNGVDLGSLRPPISLIQGFNIINKESLNNILFLLNKEFEYNFPLDISDSVYDEIMRTENEESFRSLSFVDNIKFRILDSDIKDLSKVKEFYEKEGIEYNIDKNEVVIPGLMVHIYESQGGLDANGRYATEKRYVMTFSPGSVSDNFPIVDKMRSYLGENGSEVQFSVSFSQNVYLPIGQHNIASKLKGSEAKLSGTGYFHFRNSKFNIDYSDKFAGKNSSIRMEVIQENHLNAPEFFDLMDVLVKKEVILFQDW